jgi:hypothetical protein
MLLMRIIVVQYHKLRSNPEQYPPWKYEKNYLMLFFSVGNFPQSYIINIIIFSDFKSYETCQ